MGRPKPFGILHRSIIPDAVRRLGFKAFGTKGYFGEYFNQNIFEQTQEQVLGTQAQVTLDDATIWYDDTAGLFKDRNAATVVLSDYDRISVIVDTATQDIDFPALTKIEFVPYNVVDLGGFTLNLAGTYSGELRVNNGTVNITGASTGLIINGTASVTSASMSGIAYVNGTARIADGTTVNTVGAQTIVGRKDFNGAAYFLNELGTIGLKSVASTTQIDVDRGGKDLYIVNTDNYDSALFYCQDLSTITKITGSADITGSIVGTIARFTVPLLSNFSVLRISV